MLSHLIFRQLASPSPLFGWLVGLIWNRRNAALNDAVLKILELQPGDRVLEVGFGGGYLLRRMAGIVSEGYLAGVDVSPAMIETARKRYSRLVKLGKLDLRCASVESLPFPAAQFTKTCSVNSIFYWNDPSRGIAEMRRVLRAGGKTVLCFTCKSSLERKGFAQKLHLFEPEMLANLVAAQAFVEIQVSTFRDRYREYAVVSACKEA